MQTPPSLRLERIRGANYKAFQRSFELELAPLTVIFGRNGSGKTALLRLPLVLASALTGGDSPGLPLSVRGLRLGDSLASLVHGGVVDRYELAVDFCHGARYHLDVVVGHDTTTTKRLPGQWVDRWTLRDDSGGITDFSWNSRGRHYLHESTTSLDDPATFRGFVPVMADGTTHPIATWLRFPHAPRVVSLGAARGVPGEPFAPEQPNVGLDVESDGAATRRVLGALRTPARQAILDRIVTTLRDCFDVDLRVEEVAQGPVQGTIVLAKPCRRSTWLPLSELGTGLVHALPLLVQYAIAANGEDGPSLILCEEPEAHSHPTVHARLADSIAEAVLSGNCSTVVETHSETFVLRLRRRIAEGQLRPDQVAFYWVDDEQGTTELRRLDLDEHGDIADWPEGWFDAALHEVQAIRRAGKP